MKRRGGGGGGGGGGTGGNFGRLHCLPKDEDGELLEIDFGAALS